jgi:hypothetical protein
MLHGRFCHPQRAHVSAIPGRGLARRLPSGIVAVQSDRSRPKRDLRGQYGHDLPIILLVTKTPEPGEHAEHTEAAMYLRKPFALGDARGVLSRVL